MDSNTVFRLGAAGLLGLALFGAVFVLHGPDVPESTRVFPAFVPADPLAAELTRCRKLGLEAAGKSSLRRGLGREPRPVLLAAQRFQRALIMGGSGVIDQFLNVFTTYIDSGFGLLGGDVRFLSQTLIALDITLAGLFWALAGEEDVIARLIKKTLYIGFFAFLIGNFNRLAKIIFDSFSGLGLKAAGSNLLAADFLHPGRIAQVGLDASKPILEAASQLMGYVSFFENFVQIAVLMIAG
jgi:conjugative transfer region protein TrbK